MYKQIKWAKWFALAFATGFLFSHNYGPNLTADITNADQLSTYDDLDMTEAIKQYHLQANEIVNEFLSVLLDPELEGLVVTYPPTDEDCNGNVSTYCLAVRLTNNLEQFEIYLQKNQNKFSESLSIASPGISLDEAFTIAASQRTTVDEQMLIAEQTIDLTLAVYNQAQLVYPVHKEMLTLIQNLDTYRKNLSKIRDVIEQYPSKFNGASTAQCK